MFKKYGLSGLFFGAMMAGFFPATCWAHNVDNLITVSVYRHGAKAIGTIFVHINDGYMNVIHDYQSKVFTPVRKIPGTNRYETVPNKPLHDFTIRITDYGNKKFTLSGSFVITQLPPSVIGPNGQPLHALPMVHKFVFHHQINLPEIGGRTIKVTSPHDGSIKIVVRRY